MRSTKRVSKPKRNEAAATKKEGFFKMLFTSLMNRGNDVMTANRRAFHQVFMEGGTPEFYPKKHPVMSYARQNRLAKIRKRART